MNTCLCFRSSGNSGRGDEDAGLSSGSTDPALFLAGGSCCMKIPSLSSLSRSFL